MSNSHHEKDQNLIQEQLMEVVRKNLPEASMTTLLSELKRIKTLEDDLDAKESFNSHLCDQLRAIEEANTNLTKRNDELEAKAQSVEECLEANRVFAQKLSARAQGLELRETQIQLEAQKEINTQMRATMETVFKPGANRTLKSKDVLVPTTEKFSENLPDYSTGGPVTERTTQNPITMTVTSESHDE